MGIASVLAIPESSVQHTASNHHWHCVTLYRLHASFTLTPSRSEREELAPTHQSKTVCWARASSGADRCRTRCGCNWWDTDANRDRVHHSFRTGWRLTGSGGGGSGGENRREHSEKTKPEQTSRECNRELDWKPLQRDIAAAFVVLCHYEKYAVPQRRT